MTVKKARDKPRRVLDAARSWVADILLIAGAVMVAVGAGLIYAPAGWIAGGALAIAGGVLAAKEEPGGDDG